MVFGSRRGFTSEGKAHEIELFVPASYAPTAAAVKLSTTLLHINNLCGASFRAGQLYIGRFQ
jgi:hypothetical protein